MRRSDRLTDTDVSITLGILCAGPIPTTSQFINLNLLKESADEGRTFRHDSSQSGFRRFVRPATKPLQG